MAAGGVGPGLAAGRLATPPRPGSAAAARQPPAHQQLPALAVGRPPSRMQHYAGSSQHTSGPAAHPPSGSASSQSLLPLPLQQQAMAPARPLCAGPRAAAASLRRSISLGSGASGSGLDSATADGAQLCAVTQEACSHSTAQLQPPAAAEQRATQLAQQLAQVSEPAELQAAASSATSWLAQQLPLPAAQLLMQLVAALQASSSGGSGTAAGPQQQQQQLQPPAQAIATPAPALAAPVLAGSLRPHQLFHQCGQLRGEKAALERLNGELSSQVGLAARVGRNALRGIGAVPR